MHIEWLAGTHIQTLVEIEIDAPEIDEQGTARFQNAYRMVERSVDIEDDRGRKLVDKAVILVCRHMIGATEVGGNPDLIAVAGQINRIGACQRCTAILPDRCRLTDLQRRAADIRAVPIQEISPIVADRR